jgi:hypothetical protein
MQHTMEVPSEEIPFGTINNDLKKGPHVTNVTLVQWIHMWPKSERDVIWQSCLDTPNATPSHPDDYNLEDVD